MIILAKAETHDVEATVGSALAAKGTVKVPGVVVPTATTLHPHLFGTAFRPQGILSR